MQKMILKIITSSQVVINLVDPTCSTRNVFLRIGGNSFSHGQHRGLSSFAGPSVQPLWTILRRKVFRKVVIENMRGTTMKEKSGKWLELQINKRIVRSGSILMAALRRRVRCV